VTVTSYAATQVSFRLRMRPEAQSGMETSPRKAADD
jgi:hypothetical protein